MTKTQEIIARGLTKLSMHGYPDYQMTDPQTPLTPQMPMEMYGDGGQYGDAPPVEQPPTAAPSPRGVLSRGVPWRWMGGGAMAGSFGGKAFVEDTINRENQHINFLKGKAGPGSPVVMDKIIRGLHEGKIAPGDIPEVRAMLTDPNRIKNEYFKTPELWGQELTKHRKEYWKAMAKGPGAGILGGAVAGLGAGLLYNNVFDKESEYQPYLQQYRRDDEPDLAAPIAAGAIGGGAGYFAGPHVVKHNIAVNNPEQMGLAKVYKSNLDSVREARGTGVKPGDVKLRALNVPEGANFLEHLKGQLPKQEAAYNTTLKAMGRGRGWGLGLGAAAGVGAGLLYNKFNKESSESYRMSPEAYRMETEGALQKFRQSVEQAHLNAVEQHAHNLRLTAARSRAMGNAAAVALGVGGVGLLGAGLLYNHFGKESSIKGAGVLARKGGIFRAKPPVPEVVPTAWAGSRTRASQGTQVGILKGRKPVASRYHESPITGAERTQYAEMPNRSVQFPGAGKTNWQFT